MKKESIIQTLNIFLESLWLGIILIVPIIFSYKQNFYDIFGLSKTLIFTCFIQVIIILYFLIIFLSNKFSYRINIFFVFLTFLYLISIFISLFFSIHPLRSFEGSYVRQGNVYLYIHYFIFLFILILNLKNNRQIRRILYAILFSAFFVCLYGIIQYLDLDFLRWAKPAARTGRIFSSIGQPNFLGHWLIMIIPLTLYSIFYLARDLYLRIFIFSLLLSQLLCLYLTYSRSAWLAFIVEIILFLFLFVVFF